MRYIKVPANHGNYSFEPQSRLIVRTRMRGGLHTEVFISTHYYSIERDRNLQLLRQLNAHVAELCAPRIVRSCFTIARADREFDRYAITELPSYIIDWPASCKRALHTSVNTRTHVRSLRKSFSNCGPNADGSRVVTSGVFSAVFNFAK